MFGFNWLRTAFSRGRDALERSEIAARMDQLEMEWHDVLDKLRAREERERKRKRTEVRAAVDADCVDCGPETAAAPVQGAAKLELWRKMRGKAS